MTDQQALRQYAASQDSQAFHILVEQYQRLVYSVARRRLARVQDIEDVVQMTFLKLARAAGTIRHDLGSWLYTTTVNTANELIRRDATRRRHETVVAAYSRPVISPIRKIAMNSAFWLTRHSSNFTRINNRS